MEFRCRLATPGGEIIEGTYVAESEARLRRELEEKGLYVLSLRRHTVLPGLGVSGSRRGRVGHQEFLVFNQELATLLKAGMPLTTTGYQLDRRCHPAAGGRLRRSLGTVQFLSRQLRRTRCA